jgi:hypothetical protein
MFLLQLRDCKRWSDDLDPCSLVGCLSHTEGTFNVSQGRIPREGEGE